MSVKIQFNKKGRVKSNLLLVAVITGLSFGAQVNAQDLSISDKDFTLEALVEAAQKEGPLTVVDATGKIKKMAANFTAKYGIKTTGVKLSGQNQEQTTSLFTRWV